MTLAEAKKLARHARSMDRIMLGCLVADGVTFAVWTWFFFVEDAFPALLLKLFLTESILSFGVFKTAHWSGRAAMKRLLEVPHV